MSDQQLAQPKVERAVVERTPVAVAPVEDFGSNQDQVAQLATVEAPQGGILDTLVGRSRGPGRGRTMRRRWCR